MSFVRKPPKFPNLQYITLQQSSFNCQSMKIMKKTLYDHFQEYFIILDEVFIKFKVLFKHDKHAYGKRGCMYIVQV